MSSHKHLGMILDNKLDFNEHLSQKLSSARKQGSHSFFKLKFKEFQGVSRRISINFQGGFDQRYSQNSQLHSYLNNLH